MKDEHVGAYHTLVYTDIVYIYEVNLKKPH